MRLQIGDKVRIINSSSPHYNEIGFIKDIFKFTTKTILLHVDLSKKPLIIATWITNVEFVPTNLIDYVKHRLLREIS